MNYRRLWLAAGVLAVWAQDPAAVTREGRYWVEAAGGSAPAVKGGRLRLSTRGEVSLRGEDRADIAYALKKRVKAGTEAAARELLRQFRMHTVRQGDATEITLRVPRSSAEAELRLRVPRSLREVELISQAGNLEAENLAGALRAETGGGRIRVARVQGALTVSSGGGAIQLREISGAVRCISGGGPITAFQLEADAELTTAGGEILVRQAARDLRLAAGGGNIRVERARAVTATTAGGLIDVLEAMGPVVAETGAGTVKVRAASGLRVSSGAGAIQLEDVSGALQASTDLGNITAMLAAGKPFEDSQLNARAGDITVFIPSNLAVTVEAINSGGGWARIVSDFPQIQPRRQGRGSEARGALNGGGPRLRLVASGGTIYLRKSEEKPVRSR